LRRVIGPDLKRYQAGYRLDTTGWTVDLDEATRLVQTGQRCLDAGEPALAYAAARRAIGMLGYELLAGSPPADWLQRARVEHELTIRQARHLAWLSADAVGDHDQVRVLAQAAIADDSLDEAAYRALMLADYRSGERALALRAYARLADELDDQLGSAPDPATDKLHVAILRGVEIGPGTAVSGSHRLRPPRSLVGRDDVLDRAAALWRDVAAGTGQSLVVTGVPGSGRTAVLNEIVRHARSTGGVVLATECSAGTRGLVLHPIAAALRSYCATAHSETVLAAIAGFEDVACDLVPELARWVRADPVFQPTRLVEAIVQFVARLAADQPVLVAIDDVGQADGLTLSALTVLRNRLADAPVAVVATADLGQVPPSFRAVPAVRLGPLSRTDTAHVAERLRLGPLAGVVHTLTAGNPRFVVEALQAAHQGAGLTGELPPQLVGPALARIERAGAGMVDALTAIAALGPRFTGPQAGRVLPGGGMAILRRALTAGLLVADGDHLAFESELLRAAVCTATPAPLRSVAGFDADACVPAVAAAA
jgi:hypothetical protein